MAEVKDAEDDRKDPEYRVLEAPMPQERDEEAPEVKDDVEENRIEDVLRAQQANREHAADQEGIADLKHRRPESAAGEEVEQVI